MNFSQIFWWSKMLLCITGVGLGKSDIVLDGHEVLHRLQVTSTKGHWSDIYVECNDQVNIIT